jgi:5-hydroxyisourate hydrolase-like protein (transthyretin family)
VTGVEVVGQQLEGRPAGKVHTVLARNEVQQEEVFLTVRTEDESRVVRLLRAPGNVVSEAESLT